MEHGDFLDAILERTAALRAAAAQEGLSAHVPSCPDWSLGHLVAHLATVDHFWATIVEGDLAGPADVVQLQLAEDDDVLGTLDREARHLVDALREVDPADERWTWTPDKSVGLLARRMAQETAIHTWDGLGATGAREPIPAELASACVDDFLIHFVPLLVPDSSAVGGSVHIHCTDVAGEWTIRPVADGRFDISREHAKGDCAIRGAASDILLALWRRMPVSSLDVVGDGALAARFVESFQFPT